MTIPGMRLRPRDMRSDVAPLELDLVAFFAVVFDDLYNDLDAAVEDGLSPYEFLDGIDLSLGGAGPRVPYADEVEKNHRLAGRMEFQGLPISVEHWNGGVRSGVDPDGKEWRTKMHLPYGYIRGTRGVDGDEVDCFIGPDRDSTQVFVIHTYKPGTIEYDEDKVMLGFSSIVEAQRWLEAHYDRTIIQGIDTMDIEKLKRALAEAPGQMLRKSLDGLKTSVEKAQGFKPGTMRKWADGNWHIKLPDGSWETAYDPFSRNGWEKNRKLLEQRGFSHLDIVDEEGKNIGRLHKLGHQGSADVLPSKDLPTPAKGKPGAPKPRPEDSIDRMLKQQKRYLDEAPEVFNKVVADVLFERMKADMPANIQAEDFKRMLEGMPEDRKLLLAAEHDVRFENEPVPKGRWDQYEWEKRIKVDRERALKDLVDYKIDFEGDREDQRDNLMFRYRRYTDGQLADAMRRHMGNLADFNNQRRKREREQEARRDQADRFNKLKTPDEGLERPSEIALAKWKIEPAKQGNVRNHGINGVEVRGVEDPNGGVRKFIFKAQEDEYGAVLRKGIPQGEQFLRERAGYVLNKIVGLNNRPAVVLRHVDGKIGAAVDFIPNAVHINEAVGPFPDIEWQKLAVHQWLCANGDGHKYNLMCDDQNKKLYAIDDGLAFPELFVKNGATYRSWAHNVCNQKGLLNLPQEIMKNITPANRDKVIDNMKLLGLGKKAQDVVKYRFDYLIKNGNLPQYQGYDEYDGKLSGEGV